MSALPQALTRNWTLKLSSVGLALFLWAVVRAEPADQELLSSVPVRVQVNDPDWNLVGSPVPAEVQVRFAGPAREVLRLNREGAAVRVPLDSVFGPDTTVQLRRDWVRLDGAAGLVVQDVIPGSVRLSLERTRSKVVNLALRTRGRLPSDRALVVPIAVTPGVVRVQGPARIVEELDTLPLRPLDLSSVRESGIVEVEVDTTGLTGLGVTPSTAQLGLRVDQAAERLLSQVPVVVEGPAAAGLDVQPASMPVTVRGALARIEAEAAALDTLTLVVLGAEVQDMAPGEARQVPVAVRGLPALLDAEPAMDSVTVLRPEGGEEGGGDTGGRGDGGGGGGEGRDPRRSGGGG